MEGAPAPISFRQDRQFESRGSLAGELTTLSRDYYGNFNRTLWINLSMDYDMLINAVHVFYCIDSCLVKIGYAWHINYCTNKNFDWKDSTLVKTHTPYNEWFVRLSYYLRKATSYKGILRTHKDVLERVRGENGVMTFMVEKAYVREYNAMVTSLLKWFYDFYTQVNIDPQMMKEFYRNNVKTQHENIGRDLKSYINYLRNMEVFIEQFFKVK